MRPGEKLAEELVALEECESPTKHQSIRRVVPVAIEHDHLEHETLRLEQISLVFDGERCADSLRKLAGTDRWRAGATSP